MIKCDAVSEKAIKESVPCAVSIEGEPEPESEPRSKAGTSARDESLLDKYKQVYEGEPENGLKRRESRKRASIAIASKVRRFDPDRAERMRKCGNLVYRESCKGCGSERSLVVSRCMDRFCPTCASVRSGRLADRYSERIKRYTEGKHGYHLVLTFKNSESLPSYSWIGRLFKAMRKHPLWDQYGGIVGGLRSIEVTRGKGGWHPHIHALIFTESPLPIAPDGKWPVWFNQVVSDAWKELTGGESYIIRGERYDGRAIEMVKYLGKPQDVGNMDAEKLAELSEWIRRKRTAQTFGSLYGKLPDEEQEEPEHDHCTCSDCGGSTFERVVMRFNPRHGRYVVDEVYDVDYCFPDESAHSPP